MNEKRFWVFRNRGRIWGVFGLSALVFNRAEWSSPFLDAAVRALALALLALGIALRIWSVGHAGTHTRSLRLQAPRLITSGPYAYTRNPIYVANFVIGLALVMLTDSPLLIALFILIFCVVYSTIVALEEDFLRRTFGDAYEAYCRAVPRWLPRRRRWQAGHDRFRLSNLGREYLTTLGICALAWVIELSDHVHRFLHLP